MGTLVEGLNLLGTGFHQAPSISVGCPLGCADLQGSAVGEDRRQEQNPCLPGGGVRCSLEMLEL